jgi:hypothetical protein
MVASHLKSNLDAVESILDDAEASRFEQIRLLNQKGTLLDLVGTKKLESDRPSPKKWSFRDKSI